LFLKILINNFDFVDAIIRQAGKALAVFGSL